MIRVALPAHLRTLASIEGEARLEIVGPLTQRTLLDALEAAHPALRGTMRDHVTRKRRPFIRFFVGEQDVSHDPPDDPLPEEVARGSLVFSVIGAMAGG